MLQQLACTLPNSVCHMTHAIKRILGVGRCKSLSSGEEDPHLYVVCVRELVKHGQAGHLMCLPHARQVCMEGGWIAGHIHDVLEFWEQLLRLGVQPCPGRVHKQRVELELPEIQTLCA